MSNFLFELNKPKKKVTTRAKKFVEESIDITTGSVTMTLPIMTVSEGNNFDHWTKAHKRHKAQKKAVWLAFFNAKPIISLPCKVTLTRLAPGTLDVDDNLPMSMKYLKDAIAAEITGDYRPGRADNHPQIEWKYEQEKSKTYGVKIHIFFNPMS